jgi:hypothetical protein
MVYGVCAGCGGTGATEVSRQPWFGLRGMNANGAIVTVACTHCGQHRRFLVREAPRLRVRVRWPDAPAPCDWCDSESHVVSTLADADPPYRWRKCVVCGHRWKEAGERVTPAAGTKMTE